MVFGNAPLDESIMQSGSQHNAQKIPFPGSFSGGVSSIDGVFSNMAVTSTSKSEKPKVTVSTGSVQFDEDEALPRYEEIAHLQPPKYHEIFQGEAGDSSSFNYNDAEIEGTPVGGYDVFFGFCFLTLVFNLVGFCISILIADSYAGRYGTVFGFGLLLFLSGAIKLPFVLGHYPKDASDFALCIVFIVVGFAVSSVCLWLYNRARRQSLRYAEITSV